MPRRAVEQLGHEVLVATDGTDAWELYRQHTVDVIVSDWPMPGMDGLDLCRRGRGAGRAADARGTRARHQYPPRCRDAGGGKTTSRGGGRGGAPTPPPQPRGPA